jgi:hypothetical protein
MGAPFGGSFFSGGVVPYPTISYPVVVPGFFSSNNTVSPAVASVASARPSLPPVQQVAATIRDLRARRDAAVVASATRGSNPASRLRAARQVAIGDRHLRTANGDPAELRRAVDAYRRAAAISGDQPDTFVRQAVALVVAGKVIDGNYVWIAMQMPHAWIVKIRHVKEMVDRHFPTQGRGLSAATSEILFSDSVSY